MTEQLDFASTERVSGRNAGAENLRKFLEWSNSRGEASDWDAYIMRGKLNRTEIAAECGFALSVLRQNPAVKQALEDLEKQISLPGSTSDCVSTRATVEAESTGGLSAMSVDRRIASARNQAEKRIKALEEQNACLQAEVQHLRAQLFQFQHIESHLSRTGKLIHP